MKIRNTFLMTAFVSILFGVLGGALSTWSIMTYSQFDMSVETASEERVFVSEQVSFTTAWESSAPAVVSIVALKELNSIYNGFTFFGQPTLPEQDAPSQLQEVSSGTGFVITPDGLVVTNKHVVNDTEAEYLAFLSDGTELKAEVLSVDPLNDIALIQLSGDRVGDLPTLEFADSDSVSVGEPVLAIGNALGEYSNTSTAGIISATERQIVASGGLGFSDSLTGLIQTDAAINPGNSGGPLVNLFGEVVGMNTAIDATGEGVGFAIPANDITMVVKTYQEFGRIVRPFLGVRHLQVNAAIQERFSLDVDYGVLLVGDAEAGILAVVEGSPAEKAELQEGDVILSIDGKELRDDFTLPNAIAEHLVGDEVLLEVRREGETIQKKLTLEERNEI